MTTTRRSVLSWALYDWANSSFPTVVITFVFATYFTKGVAADEITGTAQWGYAMSLSALFVAFSAPVFGAIADQSGGRKPWLGIFTLATICASALLWFVKPDPSYVAVALVLAAIGNFAFESGTAFYNAMLADLAPKHRIGRISGWAWGLGYAGGLSCLVIALFGFIQTDTPLFGLSKDAAEHLRATPVLVAVWFAVFSIPLFLFTRDQPRTGVPLGSAAKKGVASLIDTLKRLRDYKEIAKFLLARMIYTDGLNTLFASGGIIAQGTFGFTSAEVIQFGIAINVTAGLGAAAFAWIDDWIGSKKTILISVLGLTALSATLLMVESSQMFWILGLALGLFVGPAQAASRSMMTHMAPAEIRTELFGLYAFSGKATAFLGPALFAFFTTAFDSQRAGMATILGFFVVGGLLMLTVKEARA